MHGSNGTSPDTHRGETKLVAIVGLNRETADLLPSLLDAEGIQVIKVMNPELEDLSRLALFPRLDIIIDTTHNQSIAARLRKLPLKKVDVITGMGARILFCSVRKGGTRERDGILRSIEEIREAVGITKNKEEILKVIVNTAVKSAGADTGSLMLLDASKRQMTIEASVGLEENVVVSTIQHVGKGISGTALRRGESILTNGAVEKSAYAADYQRADIVSSICCPLMYGDEAVGVINIASNNPARVFLPEDVAFMEELASLSAEVIKNAKDLEPGQHAAGTAGLLNAAREILSMKYRFDERLNLLLMKMANSLGANVCTFYEFNPSDRTFIAKASSSAGLSALREKPMLLEDFYAQRILKTSNIVCVNAAGKTPRSKKWFMIQPIRSGNELAGALFTCMHSEKNHFKEESVLLKKVGDMLTRELFRHRELESIRVQSLKYSAISQFSFDLANAKTLAELAKMILSNVHLILEAETGVLRLRNPRSQSLEVCETDSHGDPEKLKEILAVDLSVAAEMRPGKGVLKIDKLSDSRYAGANRVSECLLAMALEINGEIVGNLSLYGKMSPDNPAAKRFSEMDKEVMANFCIQAGKGLRRFHPFPASVPLSEAPALTD